MRNVIMSKFVVVMLAVSMLAGFANSGRAGNFDQVFSNQDLKWKGVPLNLKPVRFVNDEYGNGYRFFCDYTDVNPRYPRCYWDTSFAPVDMSKISTIVMKVYVKNAASIQKIYLHLRGGKNWYLSRSVGGLSDGMNSIVFHLADYRADSSHAGKKGKFDLATSFKQVNRVRFNVFNRASAPSVVTLYDIHASESKVKAGEKALFKLSAGQSMPPRTEKFNKAGKLLESRLIFDEKCEFLTNNKMLNDVARAGFNAIMPAVWHGRGAIYRSETTKIEPKFAKYFKNGRDGMAEAIKKAHSKNIEIHGCFTVAMRARPKLHPQFATIGVPEKAYDLQDPAFRDFIIKEIVTFAKRYDVDGINLDFIRTKGISYSAIAKKLYWQKYNADISELQKSMTSQVSKRFHEWQRDAVSDIVRRVSEGVRAAKPQVIISICGHPLKKPILHYGGRNSWLWVEKGWVDIVYSMEYNWMPDFAGFEEKRQSTVAPKEFIMMLGDYEREGNKVVARNPKQVVRLMDYFLRRFPDRGVALYSYQWLSQDIIEALRKGPFKKPAKPYWGK